MKKLMCKENLKINFKFLFWFLFVFLLYYLPFFFYKPSPNVFLSLKHPTIPIWVFSLGWLLSTIALSFFVTIYIYKYRANKDKTDIESFRRLFLYLFIDYLFYIVLIPTFFNNNNLFLTYILCIAIFIINVFIWMETFLINKKDSWLLVLVLLWAIFLSIVSIMLYLNN